MKYKIIAYSFVVPLFWIIILLLKEYAPGVLPGKLFSNGVILGLAIGSSLGAIFYTRRYLIDFSQQGDQVTLVYLNQFGRERKKEITQTTLSRSQIKKKGFLYRDFNTLYLPYYERENIFNIYRKSLIPLLAEAISRKTAHTELSTVSPG